MRIFRSPEDAQLPEDAQSSGLGSDLKMRNARNVFLYKFGSFFEYI